MKFEIGDYVKGITDDYGITNTFMKKGIVTDTKEKEIKVKVLEHEHGKSGTFWVLDSKFEKIGHAEMFDRDKFLELMEESKEKAVEYLSGANTRSSVLRRADLRRANLSDANLRRANLSDADLRRANLRRANLSGADLSDANLSGADLSDANLSDANLSGADLSDADLRRANLRRANLSGADLSDANLSGADLSDANLSDANLSGADLRRANLSDANLRRADLSDADLRRANLSGTKGILDAINYLEANFEKTEEGYIVYKTFGENYCAPDTWKIEPGEIIEETANPDRGTECGCGINVAPLNWVKRNSRRQPYKLLIRWEWLPGVVVPFSTDGKIRCSKAQILGITDH